MSEILGYHAHYLTKVPSIIATGLFFSTPRAIECTMLSVNSRLECVFCTLLHSQLARIAGWSAPDIKLLNTTSVPSTPTMTPAEREIRASGLAFGDGGEGGTAMEWFLNWGALCGSTLSSIVNRTSQLSLVTQLLFVIYYAPLYAVIVAVSILLRAVPGTSPSYVYRGIMGVLGVCASLWIIPVGIIGMIAVGVGGVKSVARK